jgi:hypothetical protein
MTPIEEHIAFCATCQRRMEFMNRTGTEVSLIANELGLTAEETIRTLLTLCHNLAEQNDRVDVLINHMEITAHVIEERSRC